MQRRLAILLFLPPMGNVTMKQVYPLLAVLVTFSATGAVAQRAPVIDIHLHA